LITGRRRRISGRLDMPPLPWKPLALALAALSLTACGYTQNVRAYRAYAYESPSLVVALDRTDDLSAVLDLVDTLLTSTPYSPGDEWVGKLGLSDREAASLKSELGQQPPYSEGRGYEVPVVKIYRTHLERVLADAKGQGKYPSLLDALGALGGQGVDFRGHWQQLNDRMKAYLDADEAFDRAYAAAYPPGSKRAVGQAEPPALAAARQARDEAKDALKQSERGLQKDIDGLEKGGDSAVADRAVLLRDLTAATSVAYRLELEALAMLPIIAVQATRALPRAAGELSQRPAGLPKRIAQLAQVPDFIDGLKEKMTRQTRLLELMTEALAVSSQTTVEATAGFALKESVVDQVVGVTLDSFRVNAKAGAEALFYRAIQQPTKPGDSQGDGSDSKQGTRDYTGALRRLSYDVKPILFAAFNLDLGFDYIRLPNAAKLNVGYKTDRVFSSNGSIDNSGSLAQSIGIKGAASDVLDLGLGILGVKTAFKRANFTAGTVRYVDYTTGQALGDPRNPSSPLEAPFQIQYTQIDVGYDIAFLLGEKAGRAYIEELVVGGRYFDYALPRILYELENQASPGSDPNNPPPPMYTYFNESVPQTVHSKYYGCGSFSTC
jgi:hypothetical protein